MSLVLVFCRYQHLGNSNVLGRDAVSLNESFSDVSKDYTALFFWINLHLDYECIMFVETSESTPAAT
jgi:hypothetical protein